MASDSEHSYPADDADPRRQKPRQNEKKRSFSRGLQADDRQRPRSSDWPLNKPEYGSGNSSPRSHQNRGSQHSSRQRTPESSDSELSRKNVGPSTPPESPEQIDHLASSPAVEMQRMSLENERPSSGPLLDRPGNSTGESHQRAPKRKRISPAEPGQQETSNSPAVATQSSHDVRRLTTSALGLKRQSQARLRKGRPPAYESSSPDQQRPLADPNSRTDSSPTKRINSLPHTKSRLPPTGSGRQAPPLTNVPETAVVKRSNDVARQDSRLNRSKRYNMVMEPISSSISQEQLQNEVRGIYQSLSGVEEKCIKVDSGPASDPKHPLTKEEIQMLVALHRTLLYEHHDFLMATQHPSASAGLRGLAAKYNMPARMWKYGIHAFLEVLRHRRPDSQDSMMAFIYLAYQMIALLFETVSAFTDTWVECLGDLARYRMAIEEDREIHSTWGVVAAGWYSLAADRHPDIGRLNHHLGILERPSLRKLFLFCKSLTCDIRFSNAMDSLSTMSGPIVQDQVAGKGVNSAEARIVTYHALLFTHADISTINIVASQAIEKLSNLTSSKLREIGVFIVLSNISAIFQWGDQSNRLWQMFSAVVNAAAAQSQPSSASSAQIAQGTGTQRTSALVPSKKSDQSTVTQVTSALMAAPTSAASTVVSFAYRCFNVAIRIGSDRQTFEDSLPSVHIMLVWFYSLLSLHDHNSTESDTTADWYELLNDPGLFDWSALCEYLNIVIRHGGAIPQELHKRAHDDKYFVLERRLNEQPLAEDYQIRGLVWSKFYFPPSWFEPRVDEDERGIENATTLKRRIERVQWLGLRLSSRTQFIQFDEKNNCFCTPEHQKRPEFVEPISVSARPQLDVKEHDAPVTLSSLTPATQKTAEEQAALAVSAKDRKIKTPKKPAAPKGPTTKQKSSPPSKDRSDFDTIRVVDQDMMQPEMVDFSDG